MKIKYKEQKFRAGSLKLIYLCTEIIEDYEKQGFSLTLRQLYYRLVAGGHIPNSQKEYKRLGNVINNARLAGLVDWLAIEDRTRFMRGNTHWENPAEIVKRARDGFMLDKWENRRFRPEVWVEKDALIGVLSGVCDRLDVPYFSCRGYTSQSEMWRAGRRAGWHVQRGQVPFVIHLGDHDPSGMDMTRDIVDRFVMFVGDGVKVERIALNWDQIEEYDPPPNPAKLSDSRAGAYIAEWGRSSWELDALEPRVIVDLIEATVLGLRDEGALDEVLEREAEMRRVLDEALEFVKDKEQMRDRRAAWGGQPQAGGLARMTR